MASEIAAEVRGDGPLAAGSLFHERYRVLHLLRTGGMGTVYEVLDERTGAFRALKVVHASLLQDANESHEHRARFTLEANVTGSIESDHLVRVLDAGVDEASRLPFLTMELLRGNDLGTLLTERGVLSAAEVCIYLGQASLALDKTHAAGVVHRDLKPENLFLTHRDDGSPCVKVLDFGIAKSLRATTGIETTGIMGSPLYMAPEQLLLDQPLGPWVDIYALGQTAYTLLVGEPYFSVEYERATSPIAAAYALSRGITEPLTARAKARKGQTLPSSLDAWFAQCVAKAPADRFAKASDAIIALAEALNLTDPISQHTPAPASAAAPAAASASASAPAPASARAPASVRPPASVPAPAVGNRGRSGFRVEIDPMRRIARVEVWGFWTVEQGRAYLEEFRQKTRPLWGKPWYVLADTSNFAAQKPEVGVFIEQTMELAKKHGFVRSANLVSSTLTKMQLARMSAEQNLPEYSFFKDEAEAIRWLVGSSR